MQSWLEMLGVMNIAFPIFFVIILAIIIISISSSLKRYWVNHKQPILIVTSTVVSKRTEVSHRHDSELTINRSDTKYYVTFEVESGDRLEFNVTGYEYGQCTEGDEGKLTFQGSRYQSFQRMRSPFRSALQQYRDY